MTKKIRIVFLYRELIFWLNNHSFYKECLWDGNFDIWVVPEKNFINSEILSMLKKDRVKIIEKNIKDNKYFDLRRLNPDYVLIATPYQTQRNRIYSAEYLKKFTKVLYIPYGVLMHKNYSKDYFLKEDFPNFYKIFLHTNELIKIFSIFLNKNNLILASHPIFDLIKNNKYIEDFDFHKNIWNFNDNNHIKVLWTPHWSLKKWYYLTDKKRTLGDSDFVKYADLWLKIPKLYPQLDIVMRPHPSLFGRLEKETDGEWTQEKIDKWKKDFESNNNAKIDNTTNYISQFLTSDVVINSSLAFITVLINSLKPVLSIREIDNSPELNECGKNIEKSYYVAKNEKEIVEFIENIAINKNDTMLEERKKALKENIYIPDCGSSGLFIKNFVKKDYIDNNFKNITDDLKYIYRKKYNCCI